MDHDVVAGLCHGGPNVREEVGVELVGVAESRQRLPDDGHVLRLCGQPDPQCGAHCSLPPRAASIASARAACTGSTGQQASDVEDAANRARVLLAERDGEADTALFRAPAGFQQHSEHRRVDEGRRGQVDHERHALVEQRIELLTHGGAV